MAHLGMISDLLLLIATIGLAIYFWNLSRRMNAVSTTEASVPQLPVDLAEELAELREQISDLQNREFEKGDETQNDDDRANRLADAIAQADDRIGRLEMLMAGLEDIEADVMERLDPIPSPELQEPPEDTLAVPTFRATRAQSNGGLSQ